MDVAAREVAGLDGRHALGDREVRVRQVRRAADGHRGRVVDDLQHHLGRFAGRDLGLLRNHLGFERGELFRHGGGQGAFQEFLDLAPRGFGLALKPCFPFAARRPAAAACLAPCRKDGLRHLESGVGPSKLHPCGRDLLLAQRRAVGLLAALLVGSAIADDGLAGDQRRLVRRLRLGERGLDLSRIVAVDAANGPAGGLEALQLVGGGRKAPSSRRW